MKLETDKPTLIQIDTKVNKKKGVPKNVENNQ